MHKVNKINILSGVHWVQIPEANLYILCGCPADSIKHLKKRGLIETREYQGEEYDTGPNAVLLSDILIQNGNFSNMSEFPILHMLYLQGMGIPGHINNTGEKPLLIGSEEQVSAQLDYFYRGNYGLINKEEIIEGGISEEEAERMMQIKLQFAFGNIIRPDELVQSVIVKQQPVELKNGVFITRVGFNKYQITYKDENVEVDLSLAAGEAYEPPYQLGYHHIKREYFAVVHSGEGDGWDINRPCMASILIYQGKIYLIDAGPNILASLNYLGISVNEIEGIFHTHAHDDHFAGLTTLLRTDHKFKYFATPLIRLSVTKKLCALMNVKEENFSKFFEIHDLEFGKWTNINGFEVKPEYSPHPVETNVFMFRAKWQGKYKTYAHLGDVVSMRVFKKMIATKPDEPGISPEDFNQIQELYSQKVDLKKVDVGGGMIHGDAVDYLQDPSEKLVLAHTSGPLTDQQREIGSSSSFGMVDVLIPSNREFLYDSAKEHLQFYFPTAPQHELNFLLNHPLRSFNAGSILLKKGEENNYVYLLLTGSVEFTDSLLKRTHTFPAGSLIGFYSGYVGQYALETYWASSNVMTLELPLGTYNEFVKRNNLYSDLLRLEENILFLEATWLFGEVVSFPILTKVAQIMKPSKLYQGHTFSLYGQSTLFIILEGKVEMWYNEKRIGELSKGDFMGGDNIFFGDDNHFDINVLEDTYIFKIPAQAVTEIPIVYWKLLESYEKRMRVL
ncbi:MBL fold metallo-hydrolase [Rapidithrix thailandica]|uniref:MBL fold metallo-hydrolase n=1 Tax=Rapidithrix thailandica TaxID=413964 RepID=A0AAW9SEP8_9BACT